MIRVSNLHKTYLAGHPPAVDDVSFHVPDGGFYTLLGPSGCGKTTTLRCIAGLERADSGSIELGGVTVVSDKVFVPTHRRDIGMVFQSYAVWPHMTVYRNVAFPLEVMKKKPSKEQIRDRVEKALELVNLGGYADRMATQLSGGQQQRLSVARALVREPSVLLLDEPLSNLDAKLRERMRGELLLIQKRVGITTLFVTHDQVEALSMSDTIAVMSGGQIIQEGAPRDIYHRPASEFVADFIGSANLIRGTLRQGGGDASAAEGVDRHLAIDTSFGVVHATADEVPKSASVVVAIRPEDVVVHRGDMHGEGWPHGSNVFTGEVQIGLFGGTAVDYHVQLDGALIHARAASRSMMERGDRVNVELPPDALRVFELPSE